MFSLVLDCFVLFLSALRSITISLTVDNPLIWRRINGSHFQAEGEGPVYKLFPPFRPNNKLHSYSDAELEKHKMMKLRVFGRVVDFEDSKPISNAKIDVWQYDPVKGYSVFGYNFRGYFKSDSNGNYEFESVLPVPYIVIRPAHIHIKISAAGYQTLTSQLYTRNDEYDFLNRFRPFPDHLVIKQDPATSGNGKQTRIDWKLKAK